jgi:hypothetical protein
MVTNSGTRILILWAVNEAEKQWCRKTFFGIAFHPFPLRCRPPCLSLIAPFNFRVIRVMCRQP